MAIQVVISQKGPLPITVTFKAPSDAPMSLSVHGSVWTSTANQMIGIQVDLDNSIVVFAQIFSNGSSTHRAVVPAYIPVQLKQGPHTLILKPVQGSTTTSDFNDFFVAVLHY